MPCSSPSEKLAYISDGNLLVDDDKETNKHSFVAASAQSYYTTSPSLCFLENEV